ncbi:MAG: nucleotidyltransferase domain-containing protein [Bacteroidota bacterium]
MFDESKFPLIERSEIEALVRLIGKLYQPDYVILFGSYAAGNPNGHSDVDLCIIKKTNVPIRERSKEVWRLLQPYARKFLFPKDIVVYTPDEFNALKNHRHSFENTIWLTGQMLYARPELSSVLV